ncbi:MAG: translation initiation factor IF-3 [Gammaproteobacteria bacterium]|nr:translation initiation factor IF-3 [Gammaproteobacteria bacterium]
MAEKKQHRLNELISTPEVRLIGRDGEQVGVLTLEEALARAEEAGMDLVEIVPTAKPPVCRVMDYGKFKFEQSKKAHQAKRRQKQIHVKEVKFRPATEEGDYQVKLRNLTRFLTEGDKAKVTMRFRGREITHQELGLEFLKRIEKDLESIGLVEQFPQMEGRQMVMVLAPKK